MILTILFLLQMHLKVSKNEPGKINYKKVNEKKCGKRREFVTTLKCDIKNGL